MSAFFRTSRADVPTCAASNPSKAARNEVHSLLERHPELEPAKLLHELCELVPLDAQVLDVVLLSLEDGPPLLLEERGESRLRIHIALGQEDQSTPARTSFDRELNIQLVVLR